MSEEQKVSVEEAIESVLGEDQDATPVEAATAEVETETAEVETKTAEAVEEVVETDADIIEALNKKLTLATDEVKIQKDQVVRARAHAQNEIRKAGLDAENKVKRTLKRFTEALLPVADSLEMAITHIDKDNEAVAKMAEGVELTLKSMIDSFEKVGIVQINPLGEQANPEKHQIVSQQKIEGKSANEIAAVMQKGYEYNGQVIRPAMVMVASA